jgi:hypothetical protein
MVLGLLACRRHEGPTDAEIAAENAGRAAKAKLEGRSDVKGLRIQETSTAVAPPLTAATSTETPAPPSVEEAAKARVSAMLSAWKQSKTPTDEHAIAAATIWGRGVMDTIDLAAYNASVEGFAKFRKDKSLEGLLPDYSVESTLRRVNGQEKYTVVDVAIGGALYHMGVPDDFAPIFWTF